MYPNNQPTTPQPEPQQPSPTQPPTPFAEPQPVQQPSIEPTTPQFQAPQAAEPQIQPASIPTPVFDTSSSVGVAPSQTGNKFLSILNEKAGILSLVAFGIGFLVLSIATVIEINDAIDTLSALGAQYESLFKVPSLFDATKDVITNWVFVIVVSAPWWILGLAPAVLLAVYSLIKQGLRNIPAIVTIALSLAVFINIIVK